MPDDAGFRPAPAKAVEGLHALGARVLRTRRGRAFALVGTLAVLLLAFAIGQWALVGRFMVSTDNAYVRADISVISPRIEGYVSRIAVTDNQAVAVGDVLVEIEVADYQAQAAHARAELARAQGELSSQHAERARARADLARYRPLAQRGVLSPAGMDAISAQAAQAGGDTAASAASVAAAQADLEAAELALSRTVIRAPIAGVVGDRQVQVGQFVRMGTPLMAVVPLEAVYVVANFKETQIADLQPGQPVTIRPDVRHNLSLRGQVDSIAPASGAEFSIIPTDTATGNFTKIVQRVPVRIRIEPGQPGADLLRPGLSASVSVDTRE